MYEAKTKPTTLSVNSYISEIPDSDRRRDCVEVCKIMERISGCEPMMWGTSIVGFDSYHYEYDSGHEGDSCIVGFSSRKEALTIYLTGGYESTEAKELLSQLGKHKLGKACLYIKQLSDIRIPILEMLIARSLSETKSRYP